MSEIITSKDNGFLRRLRAMASSPKDRRETGEFVCEGGTMLGEALRCGAEITSVLLPDDSPAPAGLGAGVPVYRAVRRLFEGVSSVETPRDVIFTCKATAPGVDPRGFCLILDRVRDPGNVGTILRSADAFGAGIYLTGGCADMWSPKVVRSTMGACFRVPREVVTAEEAAARLHGAGKKLYAAVLADGAMDIRHVDIGSAAVVIGNEAGGVSEEVLRLCDGSVIIPMPGSAESLNAAVAASIAMWESARRK